MARVGANLLYIVIYGAVLSCTPEELQKKIEEQKQLQQKYEKVYEEVKELRKLKYAADRKAKGPVGVAR